MGWSGTLRGGRGAGLWRGARPSPEVHPPTARPRWTGFGGATLEWLPRERVWQIKSDPNPPAAKRPAGRLDGGRLQAQPRRGGLSVGRPATPARLLHPFPF